VDHAHAAVAGVGDVEAVGPTATSARPLSVASVAGPSSPVALICRCPRRW
jgi:hypothetical protein